ncbi:hypothetical protein I5Q34_02620 [Streptomyces sp. AV19]|uniref:hypothetical protein n=1 Tax=Streptomyces sp. AV19 TaxID=2793068 RepID=UPI0018FED1EC|nr:hypothetical protein [Streptomyces sp. AV19]MBH1933190.1 hypothetical protein [Streptomyces sp. AV19]MDG4531908.1 hypothetical protein [Streptomyces sp. AV19]
MTTDIEAAAQQADAFLAGKRKADDVAFMLGRVLAEMGVRVGDRDSWPQLTGRAALSGEPYVYLGTVPMTTARKLTDALIYAESVKRSLRDQYGSGHDAWRGVRNHFDQEGSS